MAQIPVVLSIAGSDNSAGAGIQADLKAFSALGVYGLTALTCVVAEIPGKVSAIYPVDPEVIEQQIRLSFEAFPVAAIKTGMLHSEAGVRAVLRVMDSLNLRLPLVVDPVMLATAGARLLDPLALEACRSGLFARATLVTPNLDEASVLVEGGVRSRSEMSEAARVLVQQYGSAFLVKGGHLGEGQAADVLVLADGTEEWFEAPYVHGVSTHGTGCTLSAAIVAGLGIGLSLRESVAKAKSYLNQVIAGYLSWELPGRRTHALRHFL
ncbi:MAG: bifunctional hydroxymethylpyrimidine kinase/phosphomethylpyrimidine kinase [Verrucomicrobiota bacterium]|jgi:hydroxymethylpyrimidine/phosphomethylpyrimidine kinase